MSKRVARKKRNRSMRRSAWYWLTTGAVSIFMSQPGDLYAGAEHRVLTAIHEGNWTQDVKVYSFDIPPSMLGPAMEMFRATTGIETNFAREGFASLPSPGVRGAHTAEQALRQILTGTELSFRYMTPTAVMLDLSSITEAIEVTALPVPMPSSPKYTEPLRDIPQTITVIPKAVIEAQGATTLRDVLTNVPGITLSAGEGGTPAGDNLTVRGFSARNDIFVDGVRDMSPQSRDAFNLEQVEVVKGPGSTFTGRGSTGGSINLVSKTPSLSPATSGTLSIGNADHKRATADVNTPIGERSALRLNLMWMDAAQPGREIVTSERMGIAPSLAFGLGTPTRITFSYYHLQQENISDYGVPWVPANNNVLTEYRNRPAPVPRDTFYGLVDRDLERTRSNQGTIDFEHDFSDGVTLRHQFRYGKATRDSKASPPRFASPDSTQINRSVRAWKTDDDIWDNQTNLRAAFGTGAVDHALVTGIAITREKNTRQNGRTTNTQTDFLNPNPYERLDIPTDYAGTGDITGNTVAVYAFDTLTLNEKWELNGGVRWERFDVDGVTTSLTPISRVDTMNSIRTGLVYKPMENGSIYTSYGTSLSPSLEGLSYQTANTAIEPEKTYNFEVGSKWDFAGSRLLLSAAAFRVEKTNARTDAINPDDPPEVLEGRQRATGIELGATGGITSDWKVFGAYTLLNAKIVESNDTAEVGNQIQNAPRNSGNIWTTYRIRNFNLGGGARFVGKRYGNSINERFVDSFWTADAMVSYALSSGMDLRLNVYNLNDAYYYDRLGGGHVIPGAGRSVVVSTGFRF